jgi:lipoprotein-anchoring transpeptidase ErfK/SrfK
MQLTRRALIASGLAAAAAPFAGAATIPGEPFPVSDSDSDLVPIWFRRQIVDWKSPEPAGTIIVDPLRNWLWYVWGGGKAVRFGIGTGKYGNWQGTTVVGRMEKWPVWTPTPDHLKRHPDLVQYIHGMPGGLKNPMGSRAIYLYQNNVDTTYRIHGTDVPQNIGTKSTAGCFALLNADAIWLYDHVQLGTTVIVKG